MTYASRIDLAEAQAAVKRGAARLSELVLAASHPERPALGDWNVGDVAVHVSHIFSVLTATARGGGSIIDDVWDLGTMTKVMVAGESDRDFKTIAERIDQGSAEFLSIVDTMSPDDVRGWIVGGVEAPASMLLCHVLNEILIHGHDIATAEHLPWPIERSDAALVIDGFLLPSLSGLGSPMVTEGARSAVAVLDIRVRGGSSAIFRFDKGTFTIEPGPPSGRVDCHLSVDPEGFLMVAWNRKSQWGEIARGHLIAWGRKPWVALKLRGMLKNP
ncbi:MAG TPA: maleylpyruvate isomerase family mycothiol-dependent enzyme [Acidimicrobiales bacterium]